MSRNDTSRYGRQGPSLGGAALGMVAALVMLVAGILWTLQPGAGDKNHTLQTFGPIIAGLGVALGYVTLRALVRSRR